MNWRAAFEFEMGGGGDDFFILKITILKDYLLTPWSRVLLEKLTSKLCS
jgi:hypothetical protein